jgi:hypothetical protein
MSIDAAPGHGTGERPDGIRGRDGSDRPAGQAAEPRPRGHDARGQPNAETRTRGEYAEAMRRDGAVTHFHGEFKGRPLDLYTDGTRWAAADTPDREDTVTGTGDIPDLLPAGGELIAGAGEGSSRLERLRRDVYEESEDETDVIEKDANVIHDVFSRPPTSSYEATPAPEPHIFATQHPGIDAGTAATALFTFGLVIDRAVQWAVGYYDKHAKGR